MTGDAGSDTLLAHLAGKLSRRPEDIAVEALGFILRSDATRTTLSQSRIIHHSHIKSASVPVMSCWIRGLRDIDRKSPGPVAGETLSWLSTAV